MRFRFFDWVVVIDVSVRRWRDKDPHMHTHARHFDLHSACLPPPLMSFYRAFALLYYRLNPLSSAAVSSINPRPYFTFASKQRFLLISVLSCMYCRGLAPFLVHPLFFSPTSWFFSIVVLVVAVLSPIGLT